MKTAQVTVAGKLLGPFDFPEVPRQGEIIKFDLPDCVVHGKRVVVTAVEWIGSHSGGTPLLRCEWEKKRGR